MKSSIALPACAIADVPAPRNPTLLAAIVSGGLIFGAIQVAPVRAPDNPAIDPGRAMEANLDVPAPIAGILNASCKDCHSNETRWPWYARVAPFSWIITSDVERARQALNFSEWPVEGGGRPAGPIGRLTAACAEAESRRMPPAAYKRMHPAARLSAEQIEQLCDWTGAEARLLRTEAMRRRAASRSNN